MPIIEVDPFIKDDIKEVLDDYATNISKGDYYGATEKIVEKMTEFINENYVQKK